MQKPKTLYRYNTHHELEKHKITSECCPQVSVPSPYLPEKTVFRCQHLRSENHGTIDFSGFTTLKHAKEECLLNIRRDIGELHDRYAELSGRKA